jgi:hypothetical protein
LLDLSPNAVEVALHRALRRLRDGFEAPAPKPGHHSPGVAAASDSV